MKISDVKAISEAAISEKKAAALSPIEVFDLKKGFNAFELFVGKKCAVKLRRDYSPGVFSGSVGVAWLPSTEICAVTTDTITVLYKKNEMLISMGDVLTLIEN